MAIEWCPTYSAANYTLKFFHIDDQVFAKYFLATYPPKTYEVDRRSVEVLAPAEASSPLHVIVNKLITQKYIPSIHGEKLVWTSPVMKVEELFHLAEHYTKQKRYFEAVEALLEAQGHAASVEDLFGEANFLERIDRKVVQELVEKTKDRRIEELLLQKDAIRMVFEQYLQQLALHSAEKKTPTCFICFSIEKDVGLWLRQTFVPDLDRIGVLPLVCFRQLSPGKDLNWFQEQIRTADYVVIICTHDLKRKCIERESAPVGVAQEIRMAKERFNDRDKKYSNYCVYLKGVKEAVCPSPIFEPCFDINPTTFENNSSAALYSYYSAMLLLIGNMRNMTRDESETIKGAFYDATQKILKDKIINEKEVETWLLEKAIAQKTVIDPNNNLAATENFLDHLRRIQKMYDGLEPGQIDLDLKLQGIRNEILADEYRQNEHSLYVESECIYGFGVMSHQQESDLRLQDVFDSFLVGSKKVMVLQAFAGSGKTMFTQKIEEKLLTELQLDSPQVRIPLRIELGGLRDPVYHAMDEGLKNKGFADVQIQRLKSMPVLIILDGVDEARYEGKRLSPTHHLFFTNKLYEWKNAKVIFGLRIGGAHEAKFNSVQYRSYRDASNTSIEHENMMEGVIICQFSEKKIAKFIAQYTEKAPIEWRQKYEHWTHQDNRMYFNMIKSIQGARDLARIPFTLRLMTEFLPLIVESSTQHSKSFDQTSLKITESQIYEVFLTHWCRREAQKLVGKTLPEAFSGQDLTEFAWSYCIHLAKDMALEGEDHIGVTQVIYRKPMPFAQRHPSDEKWDKYFSDDPVALICNRLSPLKKSEQGSQMIYSFIHPYIQDFLVGRSSTLEGTEAEK